MTTPFMVNVPPGTTQVVVNIALPSGPPPPPPSPPHEHKPDFWDSRLDQLGVKFVPAPTQPGQPYFALKEARWFAPNEISQVGPDHDILVDLLDERGQRMTGQPVIVWWGEPPTPPAGGTQELKIGQDNDPKFSASFPMFHAGNSYNIRILNKQGESVESDRCLGMGLGTVEQRNWNIHVSYRFVFQRTIA